MNAQHRRHLLLGPAVALAAAMGSLLGPRLTLGTAFEPSQTATEPASTDLAAILEPIRVRHDLPALAAAVIMAGKVKHAAAVGVRKAGTDVGVTVEDKFHMGSCTKAMTATLVAKLVEQGKLRWDLTLSEALPELVGEMDPAYHNVTLLHLLSHRGGLSGESWPKNMTFLDVHRLPGSPRQQRFDYTKRILAEPPEATPGEKYVYANAGYAVVGAIAENATNTPWETLMRELVFAPLNMTSAGFGAMGTPGETHQPYQHRRKDGKSVPIEPGPLADNPPAIGPAGTVHCTIGDWAQYVADQVSEGRQRRHLLKRKSYRTLHTAEFGGDYALGWLVAQRPWGKGDVFTHAGSNNQNFCVVWMAPKRRFAVLVATNQGGDGVAKACDEAAWALIREFLIEPSALRP